MENAVRGREFAGLTRRARPLNEMLASSDVTEGISRCALRLRSIVDHENGRKSLHPLPIGRSLRKSFPKAYLLMAAGQREHYELLEEALLLVSSGTGISDTRALAAKMLLAELQDDRDHVHDIAALNQETIAKARLRVGRLLCNAQKSIDLLGIAKAAGSGLDRSDSYARIKISELKRIPDTLYVLGASGTDLPMVMKSLQLVSSDLGESPFPKCDINMIAAELMLARLEGY